MGGICCKDAPEFNPDGQQKPQQTVEQVRPMLYMFFVRLLTNQDGLHMVRAVSVSLVRPRHHPSPRMGRCLRHRLVSPTLHCNLQRCFNHCNRSPTQPTSRAQLLLQIANDPVDLRKACRESDLELMDTLLTRMRKRAIDSGAVAIEGVVEDIGEHYSVFPKHVACADQYLEYRQEDKTTQIRGI